MSIYDNIDSIRKSIQDVKENFTTQEFQEAFSKASEREIDLLKNLPNFDAEVFFDISGIRL